MSGGEMEPCGKTPVFCHCHACGKEWRIAWLPAPLSDFSAALKVAVACPWCDHPRPHLGPACWTAYDRRQRPADPAVADPTAGDGHNPGPAVCRCPAPRFKDRKFYERVWKGIPDIFVARFCEICGAPPSEAVASWVADVKAGRYRDE